MSWPCCTVQHQLGPNSGTDRPLRLRISAGNRFIDTQIYGTKKARLPNALPFCKGGLSWSPLPPISGLFFRFYCYCLKCLFRNFQQYFYSLQYFLWIATAFALQYILRNSHYYSNPNSLILVTLRAQTLWFGQVFEDRIFEENSEYSRRFFGRK